MRAPRGTLSLNTGHRKGRGASPMSLLALPSRRTGTALPTALSAKICRPKIAPTAERPKVKSMLPDAPEPTTEDSLAGIALRLDSLVQRFEQHPIEQVRQEALEMLGLVDALHREGINRMVELLWTGSPTVLEKALHDPAINIVLQLYDLVPGDPEPTEQAEMALSQVRPYIESHGGAVDILDVVDGVVHLRLSGS